jgi:hypothetical protein
LAALLTATLFAATTLLATAPLLFVAITLLAATALFVTITIALLTAAALLAPSLPGACGFARFVRITFCFHDYLSSFYLLSLLIGLSHFATRPSFSAIASEGTFGLENFTEFAGRSLLRLEHFHVGSAFAFRCDAYIDIDKFFHDLDVCLRVT